MCLLSLTISGGPGLDFKHLVVLSYLLFPNKTQGLYITEGQVGSKPHRRG